MVGEKTLTATHSTTLRPRTRTKKSRGRTYSVDALLSSASPLAPAPGQIQWRVVPATQAVALLSIRWKRKAPLGRDKSENGAGRGCAAARVKKWPLVARRQRTACVMLSSFISSFRPLLAVLACGVTGWPEGSRSCRGGGAKARQRKEGKEEEEYESMSRGQKVPPPTAAPIPSPPSNIHPRSREWRS